MLRRIVACLLPLAAVVFALPAGAQPVPSSICQAGAVETRHSARIGGAPLRYIVCAGTLPVRNLRGEVRGRIFYTAYLVPGGRPRPLTFVWNGGPGADSRLLQFHALGPRIFSDGRLTDNEASPLGVTDLVFVDPIGTGFSRSDDPAHAADFYGTNADIASISGLVADFRTVYRRTNAPLFLAGESFGTWRAAGVAERLIDRGVPVAGIALISGGIPLGDMPDRDRIRALSLVNRTATALALGRLSPALQADEQRTLAEARRWAESVYAPALGNPAALDPARRAALVDTLAGYQGLDPAKIDASLWVSPRQFRTQLLAREGKTLGIFDMRETAPREEGEATLVLEYYREKLGYSASAYAGIDAPESNAGSDWQYDQAPITPESLARAMAGEGPPSPSQPWTLRAMQKAPRLRVWVATGLYDSLNSCAGNEATVAALPRAVAGRFVLRCYAGGHMMYETLRERARFGNDFAAFVAKRT
ncbi:peptidase S10 [Sphingomonas sp. ZT3P38]|uniref:S10 family serine carboxypeptidase-like protein n=1 Tax=Parasphingomonas zepuensis TaxID=3096161 RepID=UPI002FCBFDA6